jgi:hypothetical protein
LAWISPCISDPWISPLINGRPIDFFNISRGLRQGCPLSPLLYILMVESLSRQLEKARLEKSIPRIKITRGARRINHSQFADNTLLLGRASSMLEEFMKALGGNINQQQSHVYV